MIKLAHAVGAVVLIDGAQGLAHSTVDVQALDCDFYAASSHKVYGPTGIGFLYGKAALLEAMPPYQGGGEMILQVSQDKSTYAPLPYKFEAGTPSIADTIGFGATITYLNHLDRKQLAVYEQALLTYATEQAQAFPGLTIIGSAAQKACILSFILKDIHPHDIGTILDHEGIAVRTGHHCAMPVMRYFNVPATVRASFAFYNTYEEIDSLFAALRKVQGMFGYV
jgi:cysteine desulfurase/selenocysteine lyase